jgi:hypothetical protein
MELLLSVAKSLFEFFHYQDELRFRQELVGTLQDIRRLLEIKEELKIQGKEDQACAIQDYVNQRTEENCIVLDAYLNSQEFWNEFRQKVS